MLVEYGLQARKLARHTETPGSFSAANRQDSGQQCMLRMQHMELSKPMGRFWLT